MTGLLINIKRTDGTEVTDFTYYANDRIETVDGPQTGTGDRITYYYNTLGHLTGINPDQGQSVTYLYDYDAGFDDIDLGRLKRITSGLNAFTYDYDGTSPLITKFTRPSGSFTDYAYDDPLKRLTAVVNNKKYGEPPVTELINSFGYTYDKDLIKTETVTNGAIIDNFLEKTTTYQPNAVNQLLSATTQGQARNYAYDDDGNMTTGYTPADIALTMTYDAENRMKTASYDGHQLQYSYAGNSLLAKMIRDGNETQYLRSGFLPIQERDVNNAITREYTWGKNLGGGIGGLLGLRQYDQNGENGQDYNYLYDGKGNVTALINSSTQAVAASYAYDPFGMLMKDTSLPGFDQPYKFSTKQQIPETGHVSYEYRTLDTCSGKWTTMDPLGEAGGMNLYRAVANNPVNWVDPDGRVVLISGHVAAEGMGGLLTPPAYHLSLILIPDNPAAFRGLPGWHNDPHGYLWATLGAQFGCKLRNAPNHDGDSLSNSSFLQVVNTPKGMSDTEFINRLIKASSSYKDTATYELFPESTDGAYNSNSFISGVLRAAGANPPTVRTQGKFQVPGYNSPLPLMRIP